MEIMKNIKININNNLHLYNLHKNLNKKVLKMKIINYINQNKNNQYQLPIVIIKILYKDKIQIH